MIRIQPFPYSAICTLAIALTMLVVESNVQFLEARSISQSVQFVPPPPPNLGRPAGNRRGGASRGDCPAVDPHLTALAPLMAQPASTAVWGLTTIDRPTFWFYVPYAISPEHPAEFVLLDEANRYIYRANLTDVTTTPGILSIALPETVTPLEVGKVYQWAFLLYCDVDDPIFTRGSIERTQISAELAAQLEQAEPLEAAALYAANGIWYEAIDTTAQLYRTQPTDPAIATEWGSLLRSVDLGDLAEMPILDCCETAF
jgi:hypothetical protein